LARYRAIPRQPQVTDLRQAPGNATPVEPAAEPEPEPTSYRDLQARAKELDIPGNQSREDLEAAIAEAER
jgi:hypothetical protein